MKESVEITSLFMRVKSWSRIYKIFSFTVQRAYNTNILIFGFLGLIQIKQQQHDINFEEDSKKKNPSPRWDLNPQPSVI